MKHAAPGAQEKVRPPAGGGDSTRPLSGRAAPVRWLGAGLGPRLPVLFFYAAVYLCLWRWVDVALIYHSGGVVRRFPSFYWGWDFCRPFLSYPGGLSEYLGAFLAQSLYYSWLGAFVFTTLLGLFDWSLRTCLAALGSPRLGWLGFCPPLFLLAIYSRYAHYSEAIAALALAAAAAALCARFRFPGAGWHAGALSVLALGLYLAASPAFLVFLLFWLILELSKREPWSLRALPLVLALALPLMIGRWVYGLGLAEIWDSLVPATHGPDHTAAGAALLLAALYSFLPLAGLISLITGAVDRRRFLPTPSKNPATPRSNVPITPRQALEKSRGTPKSALVGKPRVSGATLWLLQTVGLLAAVAGVAAVSCDRHLRTELRVDRYCWNRQWAEARAAARLDPGNPHIACAATEAAFHTGNLDGELPPVTKPEDLLLFDEKLTGDWRKSDVYFDLGYANMALHYLTESVEVWGERPLLLERLATLNLALGNIETARVFLNVLSRCPFHARQARATLSRLDSDPSLAWDDDVQRLRSSLPRRDSVLRLPTKETFLFLLQANRQNRMAFEYLMSYYLLSKDLQGFVQHLRLADGFAGFTAPPLWDEALVLAAKRLPSPLNIRPGAINREAEARLEVMNGAIKACGGINERARTELQAQYEKTYFYYYFFHP